MFSVPRLMKILEIEKIQEKNLKGYEEKKMVKQERSEGFAE